MPTVAFYTLGCKVNFYDTEAIWQMFKQAGYRQVDFDGEPADVYVINTCTVTNTGDKKSRQIIRRAIRRNPDAVVAVTGCYAQTSPAEVMAIPGVDIVIVHGQQFGSPTPEKVAAAYPDAGLVVFGHSHQAVIRQVGGVLAVTSYRRWEANERAMRVREPLPVIGPPRFVPPAIAALAVLVAVLVLTGAIAA